MKQFKPSLQNIHPDRDFRYFKSLPSFRGSDCFEDVVDQILDMKVFVFSNISKLGMFWLSVQVLQYVGGYDCKLQEINTPSVYGQEYEDL